MSVRVVVVVHLCMGTGVAAGMLELLLPGQAAPGWPKVEHVRVAAVDFPVSPEVANPVSIFTTFKITRLKLEFSKVSFTQ